MARRLSRSAPRDKRAEALTHKVRQIEAIARLADREGSLRQALIGYFCGITNSPAAQPRNLAAGVGFSLIAEWFEKKPRAAMHVAAA